jgi:hypothetical protein
MDKEKLEKRIQEIKLENDVANQYLQKLDNERQKTIAECLMRNGRIMELEEILKNES